VTLSARFPSGKYEVGVSLFQAVVLLLFNEEDSLDFGEIKARTGIKSSELVRTLQSLSLGRKGTRVLLKRPPGKDVNPTDVFVFNTAFNSDRIKFKINQIQQDMSAEESRKTNQQIAVDRVSVLEATIVRIMKARKKMTLQLLIDAVVTDVNKRFPPDVKEIKKRVESLIEREVSEVLCALLKVVPHARRRRQESVTLPRVGQACSGCAALCMYCVAPAGIP
jgi:cullin-4